jgi:microcystin degradation protein MlrC
MSDGLGLSAVAAAKAMERRPGVLSASVFCVQPWLDLPDLASAVLVITDDDPDLAARAPATPSGIRAFGHLGQPHGRGD